MKITINTNVKPSMTPSGYKIFPTNYIPYSICDKNSKHYKDQIRPRGDSFLPAFFLKTTKKEIKKQLIEYYGVPAELIN